MTHLIASCPIAQCLLARKYDSLDYVILHNSALPLCYVILHNSTLTLCYVILHNPALPLYYVILCNAAQPLYYKYMFHKQCTSKLNVHGYQRRGRQLLLAKVKYADGQDWYIFLYI